MHGELNESEFQVLLQNGVPQTTETAKTFGMKVLMVKNTTKDKKKHFKYHIFRKKIAYKYIRNFTILYFKLRVFLLLFSEWFTISKK